MSDLVLCSNCGDVAKYRGKKLCARCYQRFRAHGDFETHERKKQTCTVDHCQADVKAYGYCHKHWERLKKRGTVDDLKWHRRFEGLCSVPGCGREHRSMGLCEYHYSRESKKGHPLWRTMYRRRVNADRPWTADTVVDPSRLYD